jgi:nucleoside-diphosphate-sugar epimerase
MRIFVTGATGFIGAHFIESALDAGHTVTGLYRSDSARQRPVIEHLRNRGAVLHRGDVLEAASLQEAVQGTDCVCHFAAAFRESDADQAYFDRMNVDGTVNVLNAAGAAGVRRFVHCSTAGIHGQRVQGVIDESTPVRPWNSYERSKVAAENAVHERCTAFGMEYVTLRPTSVYGPRDERLLKLFRSVAKGRFPLFGRGDGRRHMVYVTDLAEAFLRACTVPEAANQAFIIGGPEAVPLRDLLSTLAQVSNRRRFGPTLPLKPMMWIAAITEDVCNRLKIKPPIYRRRMDFYLNDAVFSSARAQSVLGWKPKVSLAEGLAATMSTVVAPPSALSKESAAVSSPMSHATARHLRMVIAGVLAGTLAAATALELI